MRKKFYEIPETEQWLVLSEDNFLLSGGSASGSGEDVNPGDEEEEW